LDNKQTIDPIAATRHWLKQVVIGLNLCPFAQKPFVKNQIRFVHFEGSAESDLEELFEREAKLLMEKPPSEIETTLIIHPNCGTDFYTYLDLVDRMQDIIVEQDLEGEVQVASFHPDYQFAGTQKDDLENYTNRSPFPMLHLIREESLEEALEHYENPEQIPANNIKKMNELGLEKILKLLEFPVK
jgi:hypothetical protein